MEAKVSQSMQWSTWKNSENIIKRSSNSLNFTKRYGGKGRRHNQTLFSNHLGFKQAVNDGQRSVVLKVSCSSQNAQGHLGKYARHYFE